MHRALAEARGKTIPHSCPSRSRGSDIAEWRRTRLKPKRKRCWCGWSASAARLPERALDRRRSWSAAREPILLRASASLLPDEIAAQKTRVSRRLSPRSDNRRAERFLHRRFRRRAGAAVGRAPRQELAVARRRRDDPLVRLCRGHCGAQLAETRAAAEPRMAELAESLAPARGRGFRAAYRKTMRGCPPIRRTRSRPTI